MNESSYLSRLQLLPYITKLEKSTLSNNEFRKILYTTDTMQLVLMSIKPDNEIGLETHTDSTQFIRIERGNGILVLEGKQIKISDGDAIIIPRNTLHNIINSSRTLPLHLYSIYSPPHHNFLN